ncbi:polysaccharide biosynthesis protein [Weissella sagaensis]|jgi:PST family polysaccharide transporter|uniref:polysaccharide biosynthesis protein n=1 Tax=Weissella sagaensis TaxID=2559928 RepID=UPI001C1F4A6B|nr:polysaccharide biosynthesis protein [Weissella sagaensis]MBU7568785.1 polysaccharide biosynthesis protein [Weissella hellenica]
MRKSGQNLMVGAGILTLAGMIAKLLSAVYRIPFQNLVGNTGFYVYQQVYPIYGIGVVLALSGWPVFISKIITEQPDEAHQQLVARRLFWWLLFISCGLFILVYGGAPILALGMGGNLKLTPVVKAVAWMFWFMPFLAVGRGFAQGQLNMMPTAISQIIEQIARVAIIIAIAWYGVSAKWSVYTIGTWAMAAAAVAAAAATLYMTNIVKSIWRTPITKSVKKDKSIGWFRIFRRLWNEGNLLAMLAGLLVLLQLVDSFSTKGLLEIHGLSTQAAEYAKGVYDRGQPLVQLGMVLATAISTSLLPVLRNHVVHHEQKEFVNDFQMMFRLSLILSGVATCGLMAVMPVVNQVLFSTREGSHALIVFVLTVIPATLILIGTSVLQSLNKTRGISWLIILTMVIKYGLNIWLVPKYGIIGASWATMLSLLPMLYIVMHRLPKTVWQQWHAPYWWLKFMITLLGVLVSAGGWCKISDIFIGSSRLASLIILIIAILIGIIVFIIMLWRLRLLSVAEWYALPKGYKIYNFLERRNK